MGNYFFTTSGIQRDELQAGSEIPVDIWNINVGASAVIERGMLLGASSIDGTFDVVGSASDLNKVFVIARDDFIAGGESACVTQAYSSGVFHREKIKLGGDSTLTTLPFENALRMQGIHLRHLEEKF